MGVPLQRTTTKIYALSGFYNALAGTIYAFCTASGYPLAASGVELDAIAAVVLGGTLLAAPQRSRFSRQPARHRDHQWYVSTRVAAARRSRIAPAFRRLAHRLAGSISRAQRQGPDRLTAEDRYPRAPEGRVEHARSGRAGLAPADRADRRLHFP